MFKLVFAAILLTLGIVGWRVLRGLAAQYATNPREAGTAKGMAIGAKASLVAGVVIPTLVVVFSTFVIISTGHVGVVTQFSKVEPEPLYEGFHLVAPWKVVNEMSIQMKKKEGKFDAGSKDLQSVHVVMVTNYRLQAKSAPEIFQKVGLDFESVIIAPAEQEVLKAHTAKFAAAEILHERARLKSEIQEDLAKWLLKYGIELREASLANIGFDKGYMEAIEKKQVEEQKAGQKLYELQQAERQAQIVAANAKGEADSAREAAKGQADATRASAQAEADALRLKASAQADYNAKVSASLTESLIKQQWIRAWEAGGAQVPQIVTGEHGGGFLMQMPQPVRKTKGAPIVEEKN